MRAPVAFVIATAILCGSPAIGIAAEPPPPAEATARVPHMSRDEAVAYVRRARLARTPDNLVGPIMSGDVETVEALLASGVDVNDTSGLPKPALRLAASSCAGGRVETPTILAMIEVLLAHGAKVNDPEPSELSALMVAAQGCPASVVRRLVRAGADLGFRTSLGISPLAMALIVGNYDAAEALIDAGARLSAEAANRLLADKENDARLVALVKRARKQ